MKSHVQAVLVAAALAAPVAVLAQSSAPLTRAQVRAELVQLERAGYRPVNEERTYPDEILAAEARVAAQNSAAGGVTAGSSASGAPGRSEPRQ
jgi:hypothetical protein